LIKPPLLGGADPKDPSLELLTGFLLGAQALYQRNVFSHGHFFGAALHIKVARKLAAF
jgi:hypothetical protein